jgi:hypothetical protein
MWLLVSQLSLYIANFMLSERARGVWRLRLRFEILLDSRLKEFGTAVLTLHKRAN